MPMQPVPTQLEDTPVLATLDTLAMENNAQVQILLFRKYNTVFISLSPAVQVIDDKYKTKARCLTCNISKMLHTNDRKNFGIKCIASN